MDNIVAILGLIAILFYVASFVSNPHSEILARVGGLLTAIAVFLLGYGVVK